MTYHEMLLTAAAENGTETWECPSCPRKIELRWPPRYALKVIVPGDEAAIHFGGKGGLVVGRPVINPGTAP